MGIQLKSTMLEIKYRITVTVGSETSEVETSNMRYIMKLTGLKHTSQFVNKMILMRLKPGESKTYKVKEGTVKVTKI